METRNNFTEEEKHNKAYKKLKEIQQKYGFENIAQLRSFFRDLRNIFQEYDRPQDSMKGEEVSDILNKTFTFFSNIDELPISDIQTQFNALEKEMVENKVNPSIISLISYFFHSRINSEIEILRRKIIKGEKEIKKSINDYYTKKWKEEIEQKNKRYTNSITDALRFAFRFINETSDWSQDYQKLFASYEKFEIPHILNELKSADVPKEFIDEFIRETNNLERYKEQNQRTRAWRNR